MGPAVSGMLVPGEVRSPDRAITLNSDRARTQLQVTNTSARPVRVSSHYPFWQVNTRLEFDREAAAGFRLDLPAGATIRWLPGEVRWVGLVAIRDPGGSRGGRSGGGQAMAITGWEPAGGKA